MYSSQLPQFVNTQVLKFHKCRDSQIMRAVLPEQGGISPPSLLKRTRKEVKGVTLEATMKLHNTELPPPKTEEVTRLSSHLRLFEWPIAAGVLPCL